MKKIRVGLCQINTTVGSFVHNVDKMIEFLKQSAQEKVDLAVFPELALCSYPPLDLLDRPEFIRANQEALDQLQVRIRELPNCPKVIICGAVLLNPDQEGRPIQNAAIVLYEGKLVFSKIKSLLPTYDVFDESRYFQPEKKNSNPIWQSPWGKLGLSVCEDAWFEDTHQGRKIYLDDPAIALAGADFVVNVSASPFEKNKRKRRYEQLSGLSKRLQAPIIYVNQVGANDEILFDGGSFVIDAANGDSSTVSSIYEMPSFKEGLAIIDLSLGRPALIEKVSAFNYLGSVGYTRSEPIDGIQNKETTRWDKMFVGSPGEATNPQFDPELELLHKGLVVGIRDYFRKTGFKKAVIGLSGGIDSAVVACLAAEALGPRNVLGVSMPSQYSSTHSLTDAEELAKKIGLEYRVHSIKFVFTTLLMELKSSFQGMPADVTEENLQARLRGTMLMALANKRNALVLTTGNKSEIGVGYCTTYGDMCGALAPLGDVYKTRVYDLARLINAHYQWIPESVLTKPPSAELRPNQLDQDSLPPYDLLDRLLEMHFEGLAGEAELIRAGFDAEVVRKILHLVRISEFKRRQAAPVLKVSSKAFGIGRRVPIAKS